MMLMMSPAFFQPRSPAWHGGPLQFKLDGILALGRLSDVPYCCCSAVRRVPQAQRSNSDDRPCQQADTATEQYFATEQNLGWRCPGWNNWHECTPITGRDLGHPRRVGQTENTDLTSRKLAEAFSGALSEYVLCCTFAALGARTAKDLQRDLRMLCELLRHRSLHDDVDGSQE
jgi:hypothetical protein